MRLRIRSLKLRVKTPVNTCGADMEFADGLVILRAENSSGKSTVVQSIIYGLGLEGMLSASHDVPLPHVMTDSIDVGDEKLDVLESSVSVGIENAKGDVAVITRFAKSLGNKNLVSVLQLPEEHPTNYYVREGGAAVNDRGFHRWLAHFIGWDLPQVRRIDGSVCPLYVECLFPLMVIEQKKGWTAIQARMPFHYRIRDVAKKAFEYLLALDVYDLDLKRQELKEESQRIRTAWNLRATEAIDRVRFLNGVVNGLDKETPREWEEGLSPDILVFREKEWVKLDDSLRRDESELEKLEEEKIPTIQDVVSEIEASLKASEADLSQTEIVSGELFREIEADDLQVGTLQQRIVALEEDERRNRDILKLQKMGSAEVLDSQVGRCPTCHQKVADALLYQPETSAPMSVEQNLKFIRGQIETFSAIERAAKNSLLAKRRRLAALKQRVAELRGEIRAMRQTLVTGGNQPSIEAIEHRLRLRDRIASSKIVREAIELDYAELRLLAKRWIQVQQKLKALPKGDLTERDQQKLRRLREIFVNMLRKFRFKSVDPGALSISEDNYKPEHAGFDLEFDVSASDMIRTIWAYLLGLLELAREFKTNHLGLLILDEPKQQETARVSFEALFKQASSAIDHNQQVIVATSEDQSSLPELVAGVRHQYINYTERILQPLAAASK